MKKQIKLILGLIIEFFLLIFILIVVLVGIVGIFFPVLPGLVLIGAAVGFYLLLLRNEKNRITRFLHGYVVRLKPFLNMFKNKRISMWLIEKIKNKRREKNRKKTVKYGLILLGLNLALTLALFFLIVIFTVASSLLRFEGLFLAFLPLFIIFLFAAACAIVWYRFGQILSDEFKKKSVFSAGLVVAISIVPLLLILFFVSAIAFSVETVPVLMTGVFLGTTFVTFLAVAFEILIVSLGIITKR